MRVHVLALASAGLAALALGCGGTVYSTGSPGDDAGPTEGGSHDAGPPPEDGGGPDAPGQDGATPWSPFCPATLPSTGSACARESLQCEYGSAWWSVACDTVVQCQGGRWSIFKPSYDPCSPKPGPNPASCPADYAAVPQGTTCAANGLTCLYDQGQCACQVPLGGPVQIDGGTGYWGCVPEQGCPFPRPRVGTACTGGSTSCTYEACSYGQTCQGGVWQAQLEACAQAGGGLGGP